MEKKINLKEITDFLSENEMKKVKGGSGSSCSGCSSGETCTKNGKNYKCSYNQAGTCGCWTSPLD